MTSFAKNLLDQIVWIGSIFVLLYALAAVGEHMQKHDVTGSRLRVVLFVNGTLGDKSFFDSAARGLQKAGRDLRVTTRIVEGGVDPTRWEAGLRDLADSGEYDLIVTGTYGMVPYVQNLAEEFPSERFVVFDAAVDYAKCRCKNVHSILFRQNEAAYLAGYLSAELMKTGLPDAQAGSGLGVIGGMRIPVIDDFLIGFRSGAEAFDPHVAVSSQYADAFSDPAVGKEIAKSLYGSGAGLIFHADGATGQGVNEAAAEAHRYVVGVDMDQYALYRFSNPGLASHIVASVMKNVDVGIYDAIARQLEGKLSYGRSDTLGLAEGGVSLTRTSEVLRHAPPAVLKALDAIEADIVAQRLRVPSAFTTAAVTPNTHG